MTRLVKDLEAHGVRIWIDQAGLKPGTVDWEESLRQALRQASIVLLVATPSARRSRYVKDELAIATMYRRPVWPLWADGDEWIESIPVGWGSVQYVDAREQKYETAVRVIIAQLNEYHSLQLRETPGVHVPEEVDFEPVNPYKGLSAFTEVDADRFFGREHFTSELLRILGQMLDSNAPCLLALVGPSGSGKSSVVMAGLLPQLKRGGLRGSEEWVYLERVVPGAHPIENLSMALSKVLKRSIVSVRDDLENPDSRGLHLMACQLVEKPGTRVLLFIDQFEELFTQPTSEDEREHFIDLISTAINEKDGPVTVILTLRADFYDRPMRYPELATILHSHQPVLPLSVEELRDAIEKPAALPDVHLTFEDGLVGDLLFEVRGQSGALPLLQFTLYQLFEHRDGRQLTLTAYRQLGGVRGALAQHAEKTYMGLGSDRHRQLVRVLFMRLIDPGTNEQDTTRLCVDRSSLDFAEPEQARFMDEVVEVFTTQARLLTAGEAARQSTLEVSHEALLHEWTRLADWVHDARDDMRLLRTLRNAIEEWLRNSKDKAYLYRGNQLREILEWVKRNTPNREELIFIEESRKYAVEESRRERLRILMLVAAAILLLLFGLIFFALQSQTRAESAATFAAQAKTSDYNAAYAGSQSTAAVAAAATAARRADEGQSLALANGAQNALRLNQPDVAVALALQANSITNPPSEARRALIDAASFSWIEARYLGHTDRVFNAAFSPDGKMALSGAGGSPDNGLILWDITTRRIIRRFQGHTGEVYTVAFSPTGETALSGSQDKTMILWDIATGSILKRYQGHTWPIYAVTFSPDGETALSASGDHSLVWWNLSTGEILKRLEGHGDAVWCVAFSPDGQTAVSGSADNTLILWNLATGEILYRLEGHTETVFGTTFSPDGKKVLSSSGDGTIVLWSVETGEILRRFQDHADIVYDVAFSPDGERALSGGQNGTVR